MCLVPKYLLNDISVKKEVDNEFSDFIKDDANECFAIRFFMDLKYESEVLDVIKKKLIIYQKK